MTPQMSSAGENTSSADQMSPDPSSLFNLSSISIGKHNNDMDRVRKNEPKEVERKLSEHNIIATERRSIQAPSISYIVTLHNVYTA